MADAQFEPKRRQGFVKQDLALYPLSYGPTQMEPPGFEPGTSGLAVVSRAFVASFKLTSMATTLMRGTRFPDPGFDHQVEDQVHVVSPAFAIVFNSLRRTLLPLS